MFTFQSASAPRRRVRRRAGAAGARPVRLRAPGAGKDVLPRLARRAQAPRQRTRLRACAQARARIWAGAPSDFGGAAHARARAELSPLSPAARCAARACGRVTDLRARGSSGNASARWRPADALRASRVATSPLRATCAGTDAMFRNQYDTDVTTWSPQGRIHQVCLASRAPGCRIARGRLRAVLKLCSCCPCATQVEYAMEAVKQGSACVGARSKTHAVMAALKRSTNDMSSYQKKIFKVDDHMVSSAALFGGSAAGWCACAPHAGCAASPDRPSLDQQGIAISGLTADARSLCKYMRTECLQHKYVYESPMAVQRLVVDVADKCQGCTQSASGRPFGVGLLVSGVDQTGPHIYYNCPSGNYYEYKAMTIGARSQVCTLHAPASAARGWYAHTSHALACLRTGKHKRASEKWRRMQAPVSTD